MASWELERATDSQCGNIFLLDLSRSAIGCRCPASQLSLSGAGRREVIAGEEEKLKAMLG
jgi:hypothetical protein